MEKIYSRGRIKLNKDKRVIIKLIIIIIIAILVARHIIKVINPIIEAECKNIAKKVATNISNEEATKVMSNYKYEDLVIQVKDNNGNVTMVESNVITINEIISDIPVKIQEQFDKIDQSKFNLYLGNILGLKIFSASGPKITVEINHIGNVETDLRSEFIDAGINQTLHKVYLQVICNVEILTPYSTIQEQITNQVLLAEAVIIGTVPNTYYNLEGMTRDNSIDIIE